MGSSQIALFLLTTYLEIHLVHNQYSSGYGSCEPYAYYGYGQPEYTQAGYSTYSQLGCDYQSYNPHKPEQPTVIVLSDRFNDDGKLLDFLNFISSLTNGPILIPYPVQMRYDDKYSDNSCLDYIPQNKGCGCGKGENYDTWADGCSCGFRNQEQSRNNCNSGKRSDTDCSSKKNTIIHKSECCCRS